MWLLVHGHGVLAEIEAASQALGARLAGEMDQLLQVAGVVYIHCETSQGQDHARLSGSFRSSDVWFEAVVPKA
jgi:hypothetical protein